MSSPEFLLELGKNLWTRKRGIWIAAVPLNTRANLSFPLALRPRIGAFVHAGQNSMRNCQPLSYWQLHYLFCKYFDRFHAESLKPT
jgi:hypothetical protein